MLIRISAIVAIVAALAVAGLSFVMVKERIETTMAARDKNAQDRDTERTAKEKSQRELKNTQVELTTTSNTLASTRTELDGMTTKATESEKRATTLAANLDKESGERKAAQQRLTQWELTGLNPEQIKGLQTNIKKRTEERDAVLAENKVLSRKASQLQGKLDEYLGVDRPVVLPPGLKGKVIAVDPKYDFVVIDVGGNQGVLERGEMLVNRKGFLIGKIRITAVEPNRSVANVLPDWKGEAPVELQEGDQVLY